MNPDQKKSILAIALLAAFADGSKDDRERERVRRLASRGIVKWVGRLSLIAFGYFATLAPAFAQEKRPAIVHVAPVEGIIDLGLAPFVQRVLDEAAEAGAAAVIWR